MKAYGRKPDNHSDSIVVKKNGRARSKAELRERNDKINQENVKFQPQEPTDIESNTS